MKNILKLAAAAVIALTFGMGKEAHAQCAPAQAPLSVNAAGTNYTISMEQCSYNDFVGGAPLPSGLFFTGPGAANKALLAATSFFNNYGTAGSPGQQTPPTVPTPGGTPFVPLNDQAYAFAYALGNAVGILGTQVFAHVVAFGDGTGVSSPGVTGIYEGQSLSAQDSVTTIGNPTGTSQANYTVNWATELSSQRLVPEIDGPVLVQVGFALAGLYVLMLGRRRREDEVDMSHAA